MKTQARHLHVKGHTSVVGNRLSVTVEIYYNLYCDSVAIRYDILNKMLIKVYVVTFEWFSSSGNIELELDASVNALENSSFRSFAEFL